MQVKEDSFEARRATRQKLIRKKRRRRIAVAILLLLVAAGIVLSLTVLFPIKTVNAGGSALYSESDIATASGLKGNNLFLINAGDLQTKITKALPFIDSVKIKRKLPDTVVLTVKDAKEYAYYSDGDIYYTVSKKGIVLSESAEEPQGIFKIVCSAATFKTGTPVKYKSKTESETVSLLIDKLSEKSLTFQEINVSNIASITAQVDGRFYVNFGTTADLDKKIAHLYSMINSIGEGRSGDIDLSMWTQSKSEGSFTENRNG